MCRAVAVAVAVAEAADVFAPQAMRPRQGVASASSSAAHRAGMAGRSSAGIAAEWLEMKVG